MNGFSFTLPYEFFSERGRRSPGTGVLREHGYDDCLPIHYPALQMNVTPGGKNRPAFGIASDRFGPFSRRIQIFAKNRVKNGQILQPGRQ